MPEEENLGFVEDCEEGEVACVLPGGFEDC